MQGCHSKTKDSDELLFLCFFFNESSNERVLDCDWLEYDETIAGEGMKIKIKNKKKERMMDRRRHHICRVFFSAIRRHVTDALCLVAHLHKICIAEASRVDLETSAEGWRSRRVPALSAPPANGAAVVVRPTEGMK